MINLIVAMDRNGLIGIDQKLPWHRPEDLKNFARLTRNHSVMMGRNTFESVGSKPLKDRENFVLSRQYNYNYQRNNIWWCGNPKSIITEYNMYKKDLFIMGGMQVYKSFAESIERMYITVVNQITPLTGSEATFFPWPAFWPSKWSCIEQSKLGPDFYYVFDRG